MHGEWEVAQMGGLAQGGTWGSLDASENRQVAGQIKTGTPKMAGVLPRCPNSERSNPKNRCRCLALAWMESVEKHGFRSLKFLDLSLRLIITNVTASQVVDGHKSAERGRSEVRHVQF